MIKGAPDLPKYTNSIIIPDKDKMKVEIVSSKFTDYGDTYNVAPSKGNIIRTIDPSKVPYTYGSVYKKDSFFPGKISDLGKEYIARDYRGQTVNFYPVQYNPVTKKLRVYSEITVKISPTKSQGKNIFNRKRNNDVIAKEFANIYSNHFINFNKNTKYTPVEEEGNMLIICYDDWTSAMQPFVDWKNKIGRPTEMVTVTDAGGSAAAIKTYVENYYNSNGLTYLLLIGDASQVPTNSGSGLGGDSDNAYGYISGNDHYQELFVGRFSAESEANVITQVQRTLTYEDGSSLSSDWLNKTIGIGSDQGPGDDNEYDYEHVRNMQTDLIDFTYITPTYELFDGSQGGNDASGNPSPSDVAADINAGGGIITYCGHGADTYWVTSGFSVSNINNLTNDNKLPFIFDVACVNGNFVGQTCFGEAWLRAENNGNPTGAIAICASTINQSWAPPMIAEDEMVDLLVGASANGTKRTFTGLVVNGMFQMLDESSDNNMADTWTTFGDPSLMVRTDNPATMAVSHDAVLIMGASDFTVNCNFDGALACISRNGEIIGTSYVSGGSAIVPVSGLAPSETLDVVVTGFNKITYQGQVIVTAPSGPYVILDTYNLSGSNTIDFGQTDNINITLKNVGPDDATDITATLSTTDAYVTTMNNVTDISFGSITGNNGTATVNGQFQITVADNAEDQHIIPFSLNITEGTNNWESSFNVIINAPAITIGDIFVTNDNNADGRLDPGETGDINFTVTNSGHADADFGGTLSESSDPNNYLTLGGTTFAPVSLTASASQDFTFAGASADKNTPLGSPVGVQLDVAAGASAQYTDVSNQDLIIGIVPIYPISDEGILNVCSGTFYDSGLDVSDYDNNEDYTMTFMPGTPGKMISADFISFETESGYDDLKIYDGTSSSSSLIGAYDGTNSPGIVTADNINGALTFVFHSDGSVTKAGWEANISCVESFEITFNVTDGTNPIEGAAVTFDGATINTDASGNAVFNVLDGINLPYSVTKTAYYDVNGTVDADADKTVDVVMNLIPTYDITFSVTDGTNPIEGATVTFNSSSVNTDASGNAVFNNVEEGTGLAYSVIKTGYNNVTGTIDADADKTVDVVMNLIPTYDISFSVTDGTGPVENAAVTFNGSAIYTDASGMAVFNDVEEALGLIYWVTKTGYENADGTVDADADKTVDVVLNPTYTITFNVTDGTNIISGANVYFDSRNISTDTNGDAVFANCSEGSGMAYVVSKSGYDNANGTVDVDADKTVDAVLTLTVGISNPDKKISIIPNPNNGLFTIKTEGLNRSAYRIEIYSVSGRKMYQRNSNSSSFDIDLGNQAKGIYFIKITSGNQVFNSKLIIK